MSLIERRVLKEVCLLVDRRAVNVLWADEIVRDGVVLHSSEHRGAYPTDDNGEVDHNVAGLLGGTMEQIIGGVAEGLQVSLASLQSDHAAVLQQCDELTFQLQQANDQIQALNEQISAFTVPNVVNEQGAPGDE